ncbi:hypothetical protein D9V84_01475 [Bacteroidetes/Chlorobi group bacterium Naka2016]|jgi:hypothetical protein|nr:MAG: hypothetical protein D9V84_01475 [Bacteroidetes/Chlorobi group bacterium Naka2016]
MISGKKALFLSITLIVNFLLWFKSFSLDFYNDDYQILSFAQENFSKNPLKVFTSQDVSNFYFRPLPNLLHTTTLVLFGYNPLPFHILNFLLYLALVYTLYFFLLRLTSNETLTFCSTLLFALLPSHDLFLVWIASIGDILASLFILLSFYFLLFGSNKNALAFALFFFFLSGLSKESTILAPFLSIALSFIFTDRKTILRRYTVFTLLVLIFLFAYRHLVLDINILQSPNAQNFSPGSLLNIFVYPFVIVVPTFASTIENPLGLILNFIFLLATLSLLVLFIFHKREKNLKAIYLGLLWYVFFVLPAVPLFMRWYSLLPSLGLLFVATEFLKQIKTKTMLVFLVPLFLILSVVDYYSVSGWKKANSFAQNILNEIADLDTKGKDKMLLWFFPQYYNNYPILRSGVQQAINFHRKAKLNEVLLPISIAFKETTRIETLNVKGDTLAFKVRNAKVFLFSRNDNITNTANLNNDYYTLNIIRQNQNEFLVRIHFHQTKTEYLNYYFNGTSFTPL